MGDLVIFSFKGDYEKVSITIKGTDTLDNIKERLFYRGKLADIKRNLFTIILKCERKGSNDFTEIKTTEKLKEYRDPETNEVNSEIHVSFPENYQSDTPFEISDALSADRKAWGYHIFLEAGKTLRIIPEIDYAPTAYIRWSTLCSDKGGKVKKRGLNIVYSSIEAAYEHCEGNPENQTYKDKMKSIENLMKTPLKENFYSESPETRSNRVKRLVQVFNVEVVEIAKVLDEKRRFDFINEISGKIEQYSSTPLAQSSAKKAQEPSAKASLKEELWQGLQSLPKARAAEIHGALTGVIDEYKFLIMASDLLPNGGGVLKIQKRDCKTLGELKDEIKLRLKIAEIAEISDEIEISKRGSSKMITSLKEIKDKQIILIHKKPTAQVAAEASVEAEGEREAPPTVDTPAPPPPAVGAPNSVGTQLAVVRGEGQFSEEYSFVVLENGNEIQRSSRSKSYEQIFAVTRKFPDGQNSSYWIFDVISDGIIKYYGGQTQTAKRVYNNLLSTLLPYIVQNIIDKELKGNGNQVVEALNHIFSILKTAVTEVEPEFNLTDLGNKLINAWSYGVARAKKKKKGGYRDPPKRKKRKNTMRKKRKNTMRKSNKRKNTKRKNTKRNKRKKKKNTKKR